MIQILVVEHPPAVRRTLCARLSLEPDILVVAEADDCTSAVCLARELQPQVVLLDAETPNLDLQETIGAVQSIVTASVLILTVHAGLLKNAPWCERATIVGKHEGTLALLAAIRRAAEQMAT